MLLVTGGTSFFGQSVLRRLTDYGHAVRTLLGPSRQSPNLPRGIPVDVTLASFADKRGIRASLVGVNIVIHLADVVRRGTTTDKLEADIEGTRTLAEASLDAGVERVIYVSQIGADRSSAYPEMRANALAEEHVRQSGVPYTILRSAAIFGREDHFTVPIAMMLAISPLFFPIPGDGSVLLQPLWVEDLATCITWTLEEPETIGETFEIGGPEFITFRQVVQMVMFASGHRRIIINARPPYLRIGAWLMHRLLPRPPVNPLWLDYLAVSRTSDLNTLPRVFGLQPSRMEGNLQHLKERNWRRELFVRQFSASRGGD